MLTEQELEIRKTIWTELSDFYLDTELSDGDLKRKAGVFKKSGLTLEEIKKVNYKEVGSYLVNNLRTVAGVWDGFDQEWLHQTLEEMVNKETKGNIFKKLTGYFGRKRIDFYTSHYFEKIDRHWKDSETSA